MFWEEEWGAGGEDVKHAQSRGNSRYPEGPSGTPRKFPPTHPLSFRSHLNLTHLEVMIEIPPLPLVEECLFIQGVAIYRQSAIYKAKRIN